MSSEKDSGGQKKRGRPPKPVDPNSLGGKIRAARERKGLTTKQLADLINVSDPTITDTEGGNTNPSKRTLRLLAETLQDFFGLEWLMPYVRAFDSPLKMVRPNSETEPVPLRSADRRGLNIQPIPLGLPSGLLDKESLKDIPDEQLVDYMKVIKDALSQFEKMIEDEMKRRKRRPKR